MGRTSYTKEYYINNFFAVQSEHNCELFIFCSYHTIDKVIEICGWIDKTEMLAKAQFYPAGSYRRRSNNTMFALKQDNYEIANSSLNDIKQIIC
jgi:thioredoxin-related protein